MQVTSASLQMSLGAFAAPDTNTLGGQATGQINLGGTISATLASTAILSGRLVFGASATTGRITVDTGDGSIIAATPGTPQTEVATVTAAGGCTTAGNLTVTLTAAGVSGSPLALTVALTPAAHPTAAAIATAIAAALNATAAVAARYTASTVGTAAVTLTARYPAANDATLNLAIAAGLGVTAAASSANGTAGVAGSLVGDYLPFGDAQGMDYASGILLRVTGPGTVSAVSGSGLTVLPPVMPGKALLWYTASNDLTMALEADGPAIADILVFGT